MVPPGTKSADSRTRRETHTVKGKGVSFMEGKAAWHGKAPTAEESERALAEIARG